MRIALLGTGALGSVLAARLVQGGSDVVLVADESRTERLRHGLRVKGLTEFSGILPLQTAPDGCKWLLLCTKAWQLESLLPQLEAWDVPVIACQNGLETVDALSIRLGTKNVAGFVTGHGAARRTDGTVLHAGDGYAVIGAAAGEPTTALLQLRDAFAAGKIDTALTSDLQGELWLKAIVNNGINPVAALAAVPNGALREGVLRKQAQAACNEGIAVATALEIALPGNPWQRALEIMERTAENHCSMLQDLRTGRRTEIEAITGVIVTNGHKVGVPTPVSEALLRDVRKQETSN